LERLACHGEGKGVAPKSFHVDHLEWPGAETATVGLDGEMVLGYVEMDPQARPGLIRQ
jgi:hypothetical protein